MKQLLSSLPVQSYELNINERDREEFHTTDELFNVEYLAVDEVVRITITL